MARTGGHGPDEGLVEELREALEGLRGPLEGLREPLAKLNETVDRIDTGPRPPLERLNRHVRRYLPLYAIGTIWALMLALVPTVNTGGDGSEVGAISNPGTSGGRSGAFASGTGSGSSGSDAGTTSTPGTGGGSAAAVSGGGSGGTGGGGGGSEDGDGEGQRQAQQVPQTGPTRAGFDCEPGVRQLPWSQYAAPCFPAFEGDNGGETYKGVTADTITFVIRVSADAGGPSQETVDAFQAAAGNATTSEAVDIFQRYAEYFNEVFELYGRKVVFERYESTASNRVDEVQSKGREGACADATAIDERGAFGVLAFNTTLSETEPFSECAAQRGLFIPLGASYFPEQWFAERWHPFVWNTVQECERIARDVAEYMGKRLVGRTAKWAGDHHSNTQLYTQQERVFGTYVPDNDGYQRCVDIYEQTFKQEYGGVVESRFDYQLDVSRFPDQASQAVVQFKADGVTTLTNACDTISTTFLTQNAKANDWWPEWYLIGVAGQDTPGPARQFDEDQVSGHMFGMSQVGDPVAMSSEDGEAAQTWRNLSDEWPPPEGYENIYFRVVHMFNLLQASGPELTPQNIAQGAFALPPAGGPDAAMGTWHFGTDPVYGVDHTAIDDSREIYWDGNATDPGDGQQGTFLVTYDGRRFRTGEWSNEEPPVYPNGHP